MGAVLSIFRRKSPETPVKGFGPRIKNAVVQHHKGLVGFFVPLFALCWQGKKGAHNVTVKCMWMWIFWSFLWQPVNIPATGLIPIFLLPMTGVMNSVDTCRCYMNDGIVLFMLSGMLLLLLNNSGVDRRIGVWLLCSGDSCQFSGKRLVFKCSTAAFFLSMFSNRLIVTSTLTQIMTPALMDLQSATSRYRDSEPCYNEMRYIVNNAIQTASSIGSIAILHAAVTTLAFRAIFYESPPSGKAYPDIFNYFQYSVYAFPVAFLMFILNFSYHMMLINMRLNNPMSSGSMTQMRNALLAHKKNIPKKVSLHEKLSIIFAVFYLIMFFLRWSKYLDKGWGDFRKETTSPEVPGVKDATVAALFVIILHTLPKGYGFFKFLDADKKSQLPPIKPESAIMWWRFIDKNLNYGYIFLFGCGVSLVTAAQKSGLGTEIAANFGQQFTKHSWNTSLFLVCLIAVILANAMPGVAACAVWLPFVLTMALPPDASDHWQKRRYLGALAVGVGTTFGFMVPFLYTPAYFCHYVGKVPKKRMARYGIGSAIICLIILWLSLCLWAPFVWDPEGKGIELVQAPAKGGTTTTEEAPAAPEG